MLNLPERENQALALRKAGKSYEEIANAIGITQSAAYKLVTKALVKYGISSSEIADEIRAEENEKLDQLEIGIKEQLDKILLDTQMDADKKVDLSTKLVGSFIKIMERRARLSGLDAPTQVSATIASTSFEDTLKTIEGAVLSELAALGHSELPESATGREDT